MTTYIIETIAYYSVLIIGLCGVLIATSYVLMKAYGVILTHFGVYTEFIQFIYDRRRNSRKVFKPNIKRKEDAE